MEKIDRGTGVEIPWEKWVIHQLGGVETESVWLVGYAEHSC